MTERREPNLREEGESELRARYRGALIGLAAGDALGTTLEFKAPGSFAPLGDLVGGGPFELAPGEWTDDTSMALCLAESLVARNRFDPEDQMRRYLRWYREGYLSSNGRCFDIGATVSAALRRFEVHGNPVAGETAPRYGGNGSLMRLAPVPLAYATDPEQAIRLAGAMSATTHGAPEPVDACRYYAGLITGALHGRSKDELLSAHFCPIPQRLQREPLAPRIDEVAAGSFTTRQPPEVKGSGYVVKSLEAALWAFRQTDDFQTGALKAVNLGDDADTTGAVYGQLAGAYYGVEGIPSHWRDQIALADRILELADGLLAFAGKIEKAES